jgi:hypothetical protein
MIHIGFTLARYSQQRPITADRQAHAAAITKILIQDYDD